MIALAQTGFSPILTLAPAASAVPWGVVIVVGVAAIGVLGALAWVVYRVVVCGPKSRKGGAQAEMTDPQR